jgi:diaminohydroxyphosphoribosylaminopyrimidine deaminase/5-amino-6-(5-phosphoribosylamino)uracil reductase
VTTEAATGALATTDERLLAATLDLAALGTDVHPDPFVGAILAGADSDGDIVGRGYPGRFGGPHAEPLAIADAGARASGATLYCNLEPCGYDADEKRQPPCAGAVIEAGVSRVVVGQIDPHPRVRGEGLRQLRAAGIQVDLAPDPLPFWRTNPVFTTVMALERPLVHVVTSADLVAADSLLWHEDVVTCGSDPLRPDARSIVLHCRHPRDASLPAGWQVDFLDGRPTRAWEQALRASLEPLGSPYPATAT